MEKYQRKFYSDELTDSVIEEYSKKYNMGYSETIRFIIGAYGKITMSIPVKGIIKDGKVIMEEK